MTEPWDQIRKLVAVDQGLAPFRNDRPTRVVRSYFRSRRSWFGGYQEVLRKANISTPFDLYLAITLRDGSIAAVVATIVTALSTSLAYSAGLGRSWQQVGVALPVVVAVAAVLGGFIGFAGVTGWLVAVPYLQARQRRYRIDGVLPYGLILMYSLAQGEMSFQRLTAVLARSRSTYGELAVEFGRLKSDVRYFGKNQLEAIAGAESRTPSKRLATLFDDLSPVLDSGTSFRDFLALQTRHQLDRMRRDQEDLLAALEVFAQTYFVVVFVAPLFALVLLVLLSFIGADTLPVIQLLIYVDLPLATMGAIVIAGRLEGNQMSPGRLPVGEMAPSGDEREPPDGADLPGYRRARRWRAVRRQLAHPVGMLLQRPSLSLLVSVPLALVVGVLLVNSLGVGLTYASLTADPILATSAIAGIALLPAIPLSAFHELNRRRERAMIRAFPEALEVIAEANEVGMDLVASFDLVSRRLDGPVARELGVVYEDVQLTGDVEVALVRLTERIRIPEIRLVTKVLHEGYRSTGDLSGVLDTLSGSLENRHALSRDRRRAMGLYVFVLVLGVLTFLAIIALLDAFFFPPLVSVSGQLAGTEGEVPLFRPTQIPVATYRTLLFHAAIVQAVGNGLLMGALVDDRALSGLKYTIGLVAGTLLVFLLL